MKIHFQVLFVIGLLFFSGRSFSLERYIGFSQEQVSNLGGDVLGGGMWGNNFALDMRLINGKVHIFLIEFYGSDKKQPNGAKRKASRATDFLVVKLEKGERISDGASFRCHDGETSVIGIFLKKWAKEKERFPASRAWKINQLSKKIVPLTTVRSVSCDWFRNGDEDFPKNF